MRIWLFRWGEALFTSYWVIPALMAFGAVVLSFSAVAADVYLGSGWLKGIDWLFLNQPEGARSVLSTIAGSMITVAGVTFSITIAAVAQTTSTFGPRLMTNFMQDRGNQITLGTFVATFLYCLLVLRTVRSGTDEAATAAFVPHLAIFGALLLAVASLSVLIYFIHHVPESIHISNVVARVGQDLNDHLAQLFPERLGHGADEEPAGGEDDDGLDPARAARLGDRGAAPVEAADSGYVQFVDGDGLMACAREHDLVLSLRCGPGSFVSSGRVLALVWPAERLDDESAAKIRDGFALGGYRSPRQDPAYLAHRLVEVAARALSPGMNDLFTATNAMDWLGSALSNLAGRRIPSALRHDGDGALRVIAEPVSFEGIADQVLDRLRPYVEADPNAAVHLMKVIRDVAGAARTGEQRRALRRHATALWDACEGALSRDRDLAAIRAAYHGVRRRLGDEPGAAYPEPSGAAAQR